MNRVRYGEARSAARVTLQVSSELGCRRIEIDVPHRRGAPAISGPQPRAYSRHQQRVGPEVIEEMAFDGDRVANENVAKRLDDEAFGVVARLDNGSVAVRARHRWWRKLAQVHLVGDRHREDRQLLQISRHHVVGESCLECAGYLLTRQRRGIAAKRIVGDEFLLLRVGLPGRHHGLGDGRQLEDGRLDLTQLDANAADLHLGIDATVILDVAGRIQPPEIASTIDAP